MKKIVIITLAWVTLLGIGINKTMNAKASEITNNEHKEINYQNIISIEKQIKKTTILDDAFKSEAEGNFETLNDPFYSAWASIAGELPFLRLNYDPSMQNGVITKNPFYVFGGMNYSLKAQQYSNVFVRIKDINTGEVYLSKKLPEDYTEPGLKLNFPKDTQVSIQLTSPTGGDSKIYRFTLTLDDI